MAMLETDALLDCLSQAERALRRGMMAEAQERVVEIIDQVQLRLNGAAVGQHEAELLRRMLEAQQGRDWIALADLLAFELPQSGVLRKRE